MFQNNKKIRRKDGGDNLKVAIGSDHGGYKLKKRLLSLLELKDYEVADMGTHSEASCDYPLYGRKVAEAVASGEFDRGVLICKTGIGMSITANKVHEIRAALCRTKKDAQLSREHNDANVLVLSALNTKQDTLKDIVNVWFKTEFQKGRHARRVKQMMKIEEK